MHNIVIWKFIYNLCNLIMKLISENIYGEVVITEQPKLIII
jgi:hypothetical protein